VISAGTVLTGTTPVYDLRSWTAEFEGRELCATGLLAR